MTKTVLEGLRIVPEPPIARAERLLEAIAAGKFGPQGQRAAERLAHRLLDEQMARESQSVDLTPFLEKARRIRDADGAMANEYPAKAEAPPWKDVMADKVLGHETQNLTPAAAEKVGVTREGAFAQYRGETSPGASADTYRGKPITVRKVENGTLTLEDVLDIYRLSGCAAGAQVLSKDRVICWVGNLKEGLRRPPRPPSVWLDMDTDSVRAPLFHDCRGSNALEHAAKWLLEQRELRS